MFKNVLVSVSDKAGLVDFIKPLAQAGARIVSTGGTAAHLEEFGVPVVQVSEQTGFPEVMDGRVKTLHPKIHMALLARPQHKGDLEELNAHQLQPFDLVVVNLYPFGQDPSVDLIDIGGPAMLRASAKNFEQITVICNPQDYNFIKEKNYKTSLQDRRELSSKAFFHVSAYDSMIAKWMSGHFSDKADYSFGGKKVQTLRYGENPQQNAVWLKDPIAKNGLHNAEILQGKELSYNNLLDIDAALRCLREFSESACCVAVKHTNPCGVAVASDISQAVNKCIMADSKSIFGGIIALNQTLDRSTAEMLSEIFLECIIAPEITAEAKNILSLKKNLRILIWPKLMQANEEVSARSILGGFLVQNNDVASEPWSNQWKIIGDTPDESVKRDLIFAWKVCAHLKSNAIAIAQDGQTLGLGMGQVNRVDSVAQALNRWKTIHHNQSNPVLASDAFFPFADSIEVIAAAGIKHVIQPGGSVKDDDVIHSAKKHGVNMILTGIRHFRH